MLLYEQQYNLISGLFLTFSNDTLDKDTCIALSVNHNVAKRESMMKQYNYRKYSSWTKSNFMLACLYVNFVKGASTFNAAFKLMGNLDEKEVLQFKRDLKFYNISIKDDLIYLRKAYIGSPTCTEIITDYQTGSISWFTTYEYVKTKDENLTRLQKKIILKMKTMRRFLSLNDDIMKTIRDLTNNLDL